MQKGKIREQIILNARFEDRKINNTHQKGVAFVHQKFSKEAKFFPKIVQGCRNWFATQNWCPYHKTEKIYFSLKKRIGRLPPKKWVPGSNLKMVFRKKVGPRQGMKPAQP